MAVADIIEQKLRDAFEVVFVQVENESHLHNVPPGSEMHFKVVLVTAAFEGLRKVARHQKIYPLLREEFDQGLHALALHTYTPDEWAELNQAAPDSPQCASKKNG